MSDTSSVYRICPQCGQSVSVAAKFCPTCGTPFAEEESDFVAYERYQAPVTPAVDLSQTQPYTPITEEIPSYQEPADGYNYGEEAPVGEAAYGFHHARTEADEDIANPGVRTNPLAEGNKKGLMVTVVAAVLLIAVIAVGIVMAFKLGIVGKNEEPDPLTLAQEQYDLQNYQEAINQLEALVASGEATVETYQLLAQTYENVEQPEKAADAYLRGFQELKDSTLKKSAIDAYLTMGDDARAESDNVSAKDHYNTVLEKLDPSNSTAIAGLASLKQEVVPTPTPGGEAEEEKDPQESPEASPTASGVPAPSPSATRPATPSPTTSATVVLEEEEVVVTPTPKPSPTPTPTPKPSPSVKPSPSPSPKPSPSPSPSPTPTPDPSFTLNGHTYKIVVGDFTWWQAQDDAAAKGGHVVTITSGEEFDKCAALANSYGLVFMWLDCDVVSVDQWDTVSWRTGEAMDYTNWYTGEPSGGEEYYLSMFKVNGNWYFNDAANVVNEYSGKKGYILEIDG